MAEEIQLVNRAKDLAKEISEKSGVRVKVNPKIKGDPQVLTEVETNAQEALSGIDDDY